MDYYDVLFASKSNGGGGGGGGITPAIKTALLACFSKVAWVDEDGQDYYDTLLNAMYSPAVLSSITAVYSGGSVYTTTSLDSLKSDLVVTAHWSDSSTSIVSDEYYTLSGTLVEGTSVVTVTYLGKTATFNVTVVARGLASGTHTFATSGETITVSNGNHIKIDIPSNLTETTGHFYNLSDLALNDANSSLTANNSANVNNLSNILFNIPANSTVVLTMSNMTVSRDDLFTSGSIGNKQFVCTARKTGTNTSAFTAVGYPNTSTDQFQTTMSIAQSTDISCFFIYLMGVKANTVEFDLSLTVDGEPYI